MEDTPLPARRSGESERLRGVALGLCIPLGVFGAHRFYVGKVGTGVLQLCTLGGMGLWWLYDAILIASGEFRDIEDRRLAAWSREDLAERRPGRADRQLGGQVMEELDSVQNEVHELAERVDFLERMLAQARDVEQLKGDRR